MLCYCLTFAFVDVVVVPYLSLCGRGETNTSFFLFSFLFPPFSALDRTLLLHEPSFNLLLLLFGAHTTRTLLPLRRPISSSLLGALLSAAAKRGLNSVRKKEESLEVSFGLSLFPSLFLTSQPYPTFDTIGRRCSVYSTIKRENGENNIINEE